MMRLLIVEARRAMARGVTRLLILIALLGLVATMVGLFASTKSADVIRADMARAEQAAFGADGSYPTDREASISRCVATMTARASSVPSTTAIATPNRGSTAPTTRAPDDWSDVNSGQATPARVRAYCEEQHRGFVSSGSSRSGGSRYYYGPKIFEYTSLWEPGGDQGTLLLPASLLFFGGLIAGASLIGSEWQTGSFVMFLTWEPRRIRIFLAKAAVYASLAFVIGFVLLVLFAAAIYPTAAIKGSTEGMTSEWWQSMFGAMLRMSAITAFAAALGSSLAMIGRRTALALIGVFAYLFIVESLIGSFVESIRPWLLGMNIAVFMTGVDIENGAFVRSPVQAGLTLLGYTVAFVALAAAAFRRRDFASS